MTQRSIFFIASFCKDVLLCLTRRVGLTLATRITLRQRHGPFSKKSGADPGTANCIHDRRTYRSAYRSLFGSRGSRCSKTVLRTGSRRSRGCAIFRVASKKRRNSQLKFQPVFYRRHFNRRRGAEARSAVCDTPVSGSPKLHDCGRLLVIRLRKHVSSAQKQDRYQDTLCHVQWRPSPGRSALTAERKTVACSVPCDPVNAALSAKLTHYQLSFQNIPQTPGTAGRAASFLPHH